jgi:PKD repeat protein
VDLLSGSNRLTVNGTQAADTVTVTGALVTVAGRTTVNYSNAQSLTVNGLAGNDSFTVTPSATTAIFADGGDPIGALPGNQLKVVSVATDTVTFSAGPTSDSGIVLVNANQPVSFVHFNLLVPPQISSGPTATPNPALVGQTVNFSVAATGGFAALTFSWDFGDGTLGTGATTTHTYSAAGSFTVTLSVSDGVNPAVTGTVSVTVNAPATIVGTGPDTDGDGFSDSFETAVGTDPNSAASTPTGAPATAGAVKKLSVVKASIKLNFSKPGSDSIAISGGLLIPDGFNISGQTVFLDVGGVAKKFVLDGKGSSPKGNDLFAVAVKSGKGGTPLQVAKYSIKLSKGNFATALADDGLTNTTISKSVTIPVTVIFNGDILQKSLTQTYKATTGKSGATK